MRKLGIGCAVVAAAALLVVGAGCGGSDESVSQTPADATTVVNTAPQTDSEGKTVPAPGADTAPPEGETGAAPPPAGGDVAAGTTKFEEVCQGCHPNAGQQAGAGPKLAGVGLDAAGIESQIVNGGNGMPAGLVSGADLDNVTAFVVSIQ